MRSMKGSSWGSSGQNGAFMTIVAQANLSMMAESLRIPSVIN